MLVRVSTALVSFASSAVGAMDAVTPSGAPSTESVTLPENPPERATVMLDVAVLPAVRLTAAGAAKIEKAGVAAAVMVRLLVAVCCRTPSPVAVSVMLADPGTAAADTSSVIVPLEEEPGMVTADAVTPAGSPLAVTVTEPEKPPPLVMLTGMLALPPCTALMVGGTPLSAIVGAETSRLKLADEGSTPAPDAVIWKDGALPAAASSPALTVIVADEVLPLSDAGLNTTLTPEGTPVAASCTAPV